MTSTTMVLLLLETPNPPPQTKLSPPQNNPNPIPNLKLQLSTIHRESPQQQQLQYPPWGHHLPRTLFPPHQKLPQSKKKKNQRFRRCRPEWILQFKRNGDLDLNGTFVNKSQVEKGVYVALHVGDVIRFGHSSRLYIFQGPPDLMPPEADRKIHRNAKIRQEMQDQEASLQRARLEASLADGVSWGMGEDAIQEVEDDCDEVTWQTYKGQLTEKQEKTRDKVLKRTEKIAHMKKEIDAIRAKDIAQGGLTQGQQTQIARNEQRITQVKIYEDKSNGRTGKLEETLNESIRESLGARSGRISRGKGKGTGEDEEDFSSDDDEFYDRTKKPSVQKAGENLSVETADTLLDKKML
uniref:FHA domain-containing protein n=1 Tax=Salix viminalis TaxID=40686 RepID=A0A6N2LGS3_SALVM